MSFWNRISALLSPKVEKTADSRAHFSATNATPGDLSSALVTNSAREKYSTYMKAYMAVPEVYACVNLVADSIAKQETVLTSTTRYTPGKEKRTGSFYNLINNPHPYFTFSEYIQRLYILRKIFGFSILAGIPNSLYILLFLSNYLLQFLLILKLL